MAIRHNPERPTIIERQKDRDISDALLQAGLSARYAPMEGTDKCIEMVTLSTNYMRTIIKMENYRTRQDKSYELQQLEEQRRYYHEMLCTKILGIRYDQLNRQNKDAISNFAAYLTNRTEYVDTW